MTYATKQDLVDRYTETELAQLTDEEAGEVIDDTVMNKALADTDAEIDSYLQGRYTLPLASTPPRLNLAACRIARFHLYKDKPTEHVRQAYDDEIAWLKLVAAGKISIGPAEEGESEAPPSGNTVVIESAGNVFDRKTSTAFI